MPFSDEVRARLDADAAEIIGRYPKSRSALLPLLHLVQAEEGYVSADGIEFCAGQLGLTEAEVTAVVSFYTMYKRGPVGEYHVGVCTNTLCAIMGGDQIFAELREHLGVGQRRDHPDGKVSLEHVECNAACDYAPVVMVNWEFFDNMTPDSARELVDDLRAGKPSHAQPRRAAAVHLAAGGPDPGRFPGWPGGRRGHRRPAHARACGSRRSAAGRRTTGAWHDPVLSSDAYRALGRARLVHAGRLSAHRRLPGPAEALGMDPDEVIQMVKDSGLRGRGGAGFPTGLKWGFIPQGDDKPHYLVVNADESEPGTCKDIPLMLANPHALIEGAVITAYAIRADRAFIYVRGEVLHVIRRLQHAVAEAYEAGYLGDDILGSGFDLDVVVHAGAGAYICGEETALLDSLEGYRGQPRLKPPFPAIAGLYACPTVVNNVESIASVPFIVRHGAAAFAALGTEKSKGFGIFSLSGHVTTPGQYEAPLGITLRELLDLAGGVRAGHALKFWTPGGSSTPMFTDEHLDVPLDFESVGAAGSMLGTRSLQIFDDTTCVVRVVLRWTEFYEHESCGKCTPCREGTYWMVRVLERLDRGDGTEEDLEKLLDICDNITGRAFCALGDGAISPVVSSIKYFRDEYIEHLKRGGCPFDPAASTAWADGGQMTNDRTS